MADLGRWLGGDYRIPATADSADDMAADAPPDLPGDDQD
jgi:endogenous inhibitor of DNA gyrase (YacG/DUF329 family)